MSPASLYHWDTLPRDVPMPLLERQRVIGEQMMMSRIVLRQGCQVPMHAHANEQMSYVLSGKLRFGLQDQGNTPRYVDVGPGEVLLLPTQVQHSALALEETVVLDVFSPPSQTTGVDHPHPQE
jgi:quercetin dioxygenase-like cupin family protein